MAKDTSKTCPENFANHLLSISKFSNSSKYCSRESLPMIIMTSTIDKMDKPAHPDEDRYFSQDDLTSDVERSIAKVQAVNPFLTFAIQKLRCDLTLKSRRLPSVRNRPGKLRPLVSVGSIVAVSNWANQSFESLDG